MFLQNLAEKVDLGLNKRGLDVRIGSGKRGLTEDV
jgi:hypothetical protein